jgi:hypothetical protein
LIAELDFGGAFFGFFDRQQRNHGCDLRADYSQYRGAKGKLMARGEEKRKLKAIYSFFLSDSHPVRAPLLCSRLVAGSISVFEQREGGG